MAQVAVLNLTSYVFTQVPTGMIDSIDPFLMTGQAAVLGPNSNRLAVPLLAARIGYVLYVLNTQTFEWEKLFVPPSKTVSVVRANPAFVVLSDSFRPPELPSAYRVFTGAHAQHTQGSRARVLATPFHFCFHAT